MLACSFDLLADAAPYGAGATVAGMAAGALFIK
jgi:hypothetical protein